MSSVTLPRDSNQALGIGQYAIDFLANGSPSTRVLERTKLFHTDAVLCGLSALALGTNAPTLLREEALGYPDEHGAFCFGSSGRVKAEKAIAANCAAVREWDSNGTNFGYRPELGHTAGEFGHNDFYPVVIAALQARISPPPAPSPFAGTNHPENGEGVPGALALKAMVLLDEIRGRLAEVFSLKTYKIDHVVHGAIASAATYGALLGATAEQIESAIGMFVAHYIPWRAIRAGKQLSDSKGASAAISTEAAILCMKRSMQGFIGPQDIFRNPESMFRQFVKTQGESPFDLVLSMEGDDFAVMGMHFKLGLYEHQSAGALQALINLIADSPQLLEPGRIAKVLIRAYEPAFSIIGDPAKRDPKTRQSADHSMVYIVSRLLSKMIRHAADPAMPPLEELLDSDSLWSIFMLTPYDYSPEAMADPKTRQIMSLIEFEHGGPEYDAMYPEGIPTSVEITTTVDGRQSTIDSGLVMFPAGHARNTTANLEQILEFKFGMLCSLALSENSKNLVERLANIEHLSASDLTSLYDIQLASRSFE